MLLAIVSLCSCGVNDQAQNTSPVFENIDGYKYAPFKEYNSYASDNGLENTKVYIVGEVIEIGANDDVAYGIVKTHDGEWNILFGYISSDELKKIYLNKKLYAFGLYMGYSDLLKSPSILLEKVQYDGITKSFNQLSDLAQISEPSTTNEKDSHQLETSQIDYHKLSKKEFADKVAKDFSTQKVSFEVDAYSDLTYFLNPKGTIQLIDAHISFFEFGYEICLTLPTDGDTNECIEILTNCLKSDLFGISFDDQVDILAHYKTDEVSYESNGIQPFTLREKKSDTFNMLFFTFKH